MEHRTGPAEPTGESAGDSGESAGDAAVWEQPLPWLRESGPDTAPESTGEPEAGNTPVPDAEAANSRVSGTEAANTPVPDVDSLGSGDGEPEFAPASAPASESESQSEPQSNPVTAPPTEPSPDLDTAGDPGSDIDPGSESADGNLPAPGTGSDDAPVPRSASEPAPEPSPEAGAASGTGARSSSGDGEPGRMARLLATRTLHSAVVPGGAGADEAQPERNARLIGAVAAVSVLVALGLGTVAVVALPGGGDSEPSAAQVEDAAVPTVGPDGSVPPSRSGSPSPSAREHRTGDKPGSKAHVGKGTGKDGGSPSAEEGHAPAHAPAAGDGKTVDTASTHEASTTSTGTHRSDSEPVADTAAKPAGDMIVGYASSRCVGVSAHKGSDGSPLTLQGCGDDAWQKWVFASDGSVRSMGLCMDIATASTSDGAGIQLARCNGGWAQKFNLNSSHDLVNTQIGKCVDAKNAGTAAGTRLQLWDCEGTSNQKWHLG